MKKGSTIFLQAVIVLVGIGVFSALLWEPHLEGRNVNATLFEIYFKDPFLTYVYAGSIPFFAGLYQAFRVLGYVGQNKTFSQKTVKALRTIKYCALTTAAAIAGADVFLLIMARITREDAAGAVMLGIIAVFASVVIAAAAAVFEGVLQNTADVKLENGAGLGRGRSVI